MGLSRGVSVATVDAKAIHIVTPDIVVDLLFYGLLALDAFSHHLVILLHHHGLSHLWTSRQEKVHIDSFDDYWGKTPNLP